MADIVKTARRIVIKVGTSILVENEKLASQRIEALCRLIADLQEKYEVILVTSGAVAAGYTEIAMDRSNPPCKRALASMGQPLLMRTYQAEFQKYNMLCAQMLLGAIDLDVEKRPTEADNAIEVLLRNKVVPIVNENDASALREHAFGDNDNLSARVAHRFAADLLVILSDIDAYYTANPRTCSDAKQRLVHELQPEELLAEATPNNNFATGGIVTKLQAAQFLLEHGEKMYLSSGFELDKARAFLLEGQHNSGTLFVPKIVAA